MNKAYEYCKENYRKKTTPKFVKLQMKDFMKICEGKNKKYIVNDKKVKQLENILKLLVMPKGLKAGESLYNCTVGYQWLFLIAILCVVYRDNPNKRRYETGVLEICRKNFKTFTIAIIFIVLFLTEPSFSKFYSVAPDGTLSRQIREAISEIIKSSPKVYEYKDKKRFKILRDYIMFKPKQSTYTPLSFSTSRMDGRMPNAWICDEAGALTTNYPIEAMQKGQIGVKNKLGFVISTKYTTIDNPLEDEVGYSKRVLSGLESDETRFSLLYEPDETKDWETNDLILQQSNPAALEIPEIWEDLVKQRALAIAMESKREEFVTKNCNIIYQGVGTETFIDVKDVQACKVAKIDWTGKIVYIGLDLAETNDNTAVSMLAIDDDENILAESWAFIPAERVEEKSNYEKVNYNEFIKKGNAIACGDRVVDYNVIEDFILKIESKYGVQIQAIGYDRRNCLSTAQKLEKAGYTCIEVVQHSRVLHSPTKLLKEKILKGEFKYCNNKLYEINFQNSRCTFDTNMNMYLNKKKSRGKIDMVFSTLDACYLLEQDVFLNQMDFVAQVI